MQDGFATRACCSATTAPLGRSEALRNDKLLQFRFRLKQTPCNHLVLVLEALTGHRHRDRDMVPSGVTQCDAGGADPQRMLFKIEGDAGLPRSPQVGGEVD